MTTERPGNVLRELLRTDERLGELLRDLSVPELAAILAEVASELERGRRLERGTITAFLRRPKTTDLPPSACAK
jgi:hypothetical protein